MADNDNNQINYGPLKRIANLIQTNTDDLYRSTFFSDPNNKKELQYLKNSINNSIKTIVDNNTDNIGEPNISRLYERMFVKSQNSKDTIDEFQKIFGDNEFINTLSNSYLDNRWIKAQDQEIDDVIKYMPKLQEALDTLKDNVLSADSFNKDFLNMSTIIDGDIEGSQFSSNIEDLKEKYDLLKFTNELYSNESKYGEQFVYCVPYQTAIQKLLDNNANTKSTTMNAGINENKIIIESSDMGKQIIDLDNSINGEEKYNINIDVYDGIIESIVRDEYEVREQLKSLNETSLTEQYFNEALSDEVDFPTKFSNKVSDSDLDKPGRLPVHNKFDKTIDSDLEFPDYEYTASDGFINKENHKNGKIKEMYGCIVKVLDRERVIPIILNDICLGYYYFEFDENAELFEDRYTTTGLTNTITGLRSNGRTEAFDATNRREQLISYIASELASRIDTKFINNNQNLKKEIYYILKYNEQFCNENENNGVKMTYIPPEDIHHLYFNLNKTTKRGVSDLALSLIPAKLWVAIYITNCLAVMTRGNDKRVYYVKQSVESNISKTLLKTINEIKKSNFGIRQLESINNVLNITGRFNDYIIPRGSDGSSPIEAEVLQGQQIEIKTELLNLLEESAINSTGVPIDVIQLRQSPDFAIQLTMQNAKFLRYVYTRQSLFQKQLSSLFTKIYNIEYGTREKIDITLPPPLFINITNTNQLITNTSDYSDNICNIYMADEQDETVKAIVAKDLKIYHLGSYLNTNAINDIINKARQKAVKMNLSSSEEGGEESGSSY